MRNAAQAVCSKTLYKRYAKAPCISGVLRHPVQALPTIVEDELTTPRKSV